MRKSLFAICSVLLVLVVSIAVLVPGCDGTKGTIEVKATLCDAPWPTQGTGSVNYTLTPGSGSPINGTKVPDSFSVDAGSWSCGNVSGGPPNAYLKSITPPSPQTVAAGGNITFTLNFELKQDAWIDEFVTWTVDGDPDKVYYEMGEYWAEVFPCQIIDVHFVQGVDGCEERVVAVNETSELWIHYWGWTDEPMGEPMPGPDFGLYVVNDLCAVNKTATPEGPTPEKVSQNTTLWGDYIDPGEFKLLPYCEEMELDVETIWMLEKETDYIKSINWLGISIIDPMPHECVLFELLVPPPGLPGWYYFTLVASAEVELMDDEDINTTNNKATSPPLNLIVCVPF